MKGRSPARLALVVPKTPLLAPRPALQKLWKENRRFRESSFFFPLPNLALLTLASYTPDTFDVSYLDENVGDKIPGGTYEIAAISCMTCQAPRAYRLASILRRRGTHVVLGGMHPTVMPREAMKHADTVMAGEAENLWPAFLEDYRAGRPRRFYRSPGNEFCNLRHARTPRFDLIPFDRYRAVPIQFGRGCPLKCEFCSVESVHGRRYRHKSLAQVTEEIEEVKRLWPVARPRIFFTDDNLHVRRGDLVRLLEAITPLKVNWMAQMDVGIARRPELLRLMARSGCSQLLVGFESLNRANLNRLQPGGVKERYVDEYGSLVRAIQSEGIRVLGMFIVGLDEDRPDVFRLLRDFIDRSMLHDAQVTIQTPLPGTKLYDRLRREGRLSHPPDWSKCNFFNVLFQPKHLSARQLARGQTWLYQQIHDPRFARKRQQYWLDHFRRRLSPKSPSPNPATEPAP